jgi:thiamine pyrophosphokinase
VPDHIGCVDHGALGALDLHLVADLEVGDILGDVAGGV